ncbi:MAG: ribonuclease D [Lysobacterales bacterium]
MLQQVCKNPINPLCNNSYKAFERKYIKQKMNNSNAIETAMEAANSALLLNTEAQISRASKAWKRCSFLGLDTEFVRERTFYANIGLVQLSDGHTVWLVDPLVKGAVEPLRELLEDPSISKIIHSPSEDLDVLSSAIGALPEPMIDTQLACALLGKPLQSGYHTAAEWLIGVAIDKDQTRSNWCARPLRQVQLKYAALDVCLLPLMWEILKSRLEEKNRLSWFEEDCQKQLDKARFSGDQDIFWQRIRGIGRLDGESLAILQSLSQWREKEARERNRPRGFVVPDPILLSISRSKMTSIESLKTIDDFHSQAIERHGEKLIERVKNTLSSGHQLPMIEEPTPAERKMLTDMRAVIKKKADEMGVESTVLASKKDLESLIQNGENEWPLKLQGWRQNEFGSDLLSILGR